MHRRARVLFCLAILIIPASRAAAQARRSFEEMVAMPVGYSVPGMDKVTVKPNLKYTSADDPHLLMDVYTPPGLAKGERRPAVLFIHGGAGAQSRPKDWGVYVSWGRLVAASGVAGVTFTHRLGFPKPLLNESAAAVEAAVTYVRANADALGVDKDRICLAAYSAGGPLLSPALRDRPTYVRCLVAFYAFLDVQQSEVHRAHESAETVKNFSPITHLAKEAGSIAPMFVARAGLDRIPTLNDSIDRFVGEAVRQNAAVTLYNHPRGVHGFDNQTPDARSREIVRAALDFMRTHLGLNEPR